MAITEAPSRRRLLTIGTVCTRLKDEFPDVSISKIRYLEDQGLLNPRRTQGGPRPASGSLSAAPRASSLWAGERARVRP